MFNRLFKRREQPPARQKFDWEAQLVWLPVGHAANPLAQEVLDCRAVALSFLSTTRDKKVAETFGRLRTSDGSDVRGRLPKQAVVAECGLRFPYDGQHIDGQIFVARAMEDKWDFYAYDGRLYVRRSWTGQLTHVAEVEYSADAITVRRVHCDRDTVFDSRDFAVAQLCFLISTHLGRTITPFPIPHDFPRTATKSIALMGFGAYGRRAQFASYMKQYKQLINDAHV